MDEPRAPALTLPALLAAMGRVVEAARPVCLALRMRDMRPALRAARPLIDAIEDYDRLADTAEE